MPTLRWEYFNLYKCCFFFYVSAYLSSAVNMLYFLCTYWDLNIAWFIVYIFLHFPNINNNEQKYYKNWNFTRIKNEWQRRKIEIKLETYPSFYWRLSSSFVYIIIIVSEKGSNTCLTVFSNVTLCTLPHSCLYQLIMVNNLYIGMLFDFHFFSNKLE